MAETVKGRDAGSTKELFETFRELVKTGSCPHCEAALQEPMERLAPLAGVRSYPARVKCATLAWHAFEAALKSGAVGATVKTE